ncbi:hypothetical protein G6O67_008463 [Ophiocordyceps sinensis]|uniref:Major facilitator superfamily (MFS) profile domain-containing protein n=2 Tax=Ophiocordyceps sinensis TaxID=72228 RepID=A0A8H4PJN1_9HYPO|nr:Major facilitator superfamily transporter [Ophiocordyceps sinensis CO18]KAF4504296.1 hypothetical protein G6O67_008463 [Ophiocordyceps sinensis]
MRSDPSPTSGPQPVNHEASETTALLEDGCSDYGGSKAKADGKPLPTRQILLLCYARLMEGVAFFSIFPYLPQMIQRNAHLRDSQVGFYSGLVESASSVAEMAALPIWYCLADRAGRKPALVCSLIGMTVGPVLFGLASTMPEMIIFRCISGFFSGAGLIIRTMFAEHTTVDTQAVAYGWFSMTDSLSAFVGPIIGGALADPAKQYCGLFCRVGFFQDYPFALPGIVIGAINATGAITSLLFLEETRGIKTPDAADTSKGPGPDPKQQQPTLYQLVKTPGLHAALWLYGQVWLMGSFFVSVLPVALYTSVSLGGVGYAPAQISLYMGAQAGSQSLWFLFAFPWLQRRMGTKGVLRMCSIGYPILFSCFIAMNALLREGSEVAVAGFWVITVVSALLGPAIFMSYSAAQLVINDVSPDPHLLGSLNAAALMLCNMVRIGAPGAATALYAVGVRGQICHGYFGWLVFSATSAGFYLAVTWLPDREKR